MSQRHDAALSRSQLWQELIDMFDRVLGPHANTHQSLPDFLVSALLNAVSAGLPLIEDSTSGSEYSFDFESDDSPQACDDGNSDNESLGEPSCMDSMPGSLNDQESWNEPPLAFSDDSTEENVEYDADDEAEERQGKTPANSLVDGPADELEDGWVFVRADDVTRETEPAKAENGME